jgi:hypothetical protein
MYRKTHNIICGFIHPLGVLYASPEDKEANVIDTWTLFLKGQKPSTLAQLWNSVPENSVTAQISEKQNSLFFLFNRSPTKTWADLTQQSKAMGK